MTKSNIIDLFNNLESYEFENKSVQDFNITFIYGRIDGYIRGMKKKLFEKEIEFYNRKRRALLNNFPNGYGLIHFKYQNELDWFYIDVNTTLASGLGKDFEEQKKALYYIFMTAKQMNTIFQEYGVNKIEAKTMSTIGLPNFTIHLHKNRNILEVK